VRRSSNAVVILASPKTAKTQNFVAIYIQC